MAQLTPAQVAAYALAAGFTGNRAVRATAVALAESGGRTDATGVNHDTWRSRDRGLWQINSHWHPEVSDAQAYDPAGAAVAAFRISHGGKSWAAWSTWANGKAAAEYGRARLAVAQARRHGATSRSGAQAVTAAWHIPGLPDGPLTPGFGSAIPGNPLGGVIKGGQDTAKSLGQLAVLGAHAGLWISDPHNWLRVVMVAGGAVGVLAAVYMLAESGAAGSTAATAARTTTNAAKGVAKDAAKAGAAAALA